MLIALAIPAVLVLAPSSSTAQATATAPPGTTRSQPSAPARYPERPVRRDIPMTNTIRRAFAVGTRDSTGRPGRNYWQLWTDYKINARLDSGRSTAVTIRQSGQMPSPIILKVDFATTGSAIRPMANSRMADANTAIVTWPVDVWFAGSRTFTANLDFGGRAITKITLDPNGRFPDRDVTDNVWPRAPAATKPTGGN
ncbi:MAG TPA: hypothetical protein DGB72_03065 [Gemmatimonadetes bacterium]|nr:hypothetical protein [Gemmatimonadota bacterium]